MSYSSFNRHGSQSSVGHPPKYQPDESEAIALLQYMDRSQLQDMLDHPEKLDSIIKDLQQVKKVQQDRETVTIKNKSLAEYNIGLQPRFDSLKQQVATAYEEVNALKLALGKSLAELESKSTGQSQDAMLAILQTEAAERDEQSEQVAEDFCDNKLKVEEYLENYIPKRTDAYILKTKAEKLAELIRQGHTSGASPYAQSMAPTGVTNTPYPAGPTPYHGGSAGFGMPSPYSYNR